ncbi:MAG: gliding motility-associated ABC transporter substrate-binding protein GldG [Bacteroidota bacterium]
MVRFDTKRVEDILKFLIGITLVILINIVAARYFQRFDLTEEKRFTIKEPTKDMLRDLDDVVYVEVYLDGELNARFKRLQQAVRETLDEFRAYGGTKIQYTFNDPSLAMSQKARNEFMRSLMAKGIQPTNIVEGEDGQRAEKIIFPGAVVSYGGLEAGVMFFKGTRPVIDDERINQSIEGIEYELASAIGKLSNIERKRVGIMRGHGELDSLQMASLINALVERYNVFYVNLDDRESLTNYDAMVIAKPTRPFSEQHKYKLDQYIMNGGKAMFLVDVLGANMDSASVEYNFAFPYDLNLDDQLFRYGIRINNDLVQDITSAAYPIVVGDLDGQPQINLLKWPFFPLVNRYADHPIGKNLDAVYTKFISTLDTVKAEGVEKTPLMFTSDYSRALTAPVKVYVNDLRKNAKPEMFNKRNLPLAYLLEGEFTSLYKNRFAPDGVSTEEFKEQSQPTKVIVVGDGDIAKNEVNPQNNRPRQLGFDQYSQVTYANEDFLLNAMAYLLEDEGIITARTKEIKVRPLDKVKISEEKAYWQFLNLGVPILLILIYGLLRYYIRKNRYTSFN